MKVNKSKSVHPWECAAFDCQYHKCVSARYWRVQMEIEGISFCEDCEVYGNRCHCQYEEEV